VSDNGAEFSRNRPGNQAAEQYSGLSAIAAARLAVSRQHRPAVMAMLAFATGICLNRWSSWPLAFWLLLEAGALVVAVYWCLRVSRGCSGQFSIRKDILNRRASLSVLLLVVATGGLRQQVAGNWPSGPGLAVFGSVQPELVRIQGILATPVELLESKFGPRIPSWMEMDRSTCTFLCEAVEQGDCWLPIRGRARLDVSGHLVHVRVGDRVEVLGQLSQPRSPANPGSMDFADFLHRQGISSLLRVEHPAAVRKLETLTAWKWKLARWRESVRSQCLQLLFRVLDREQCGLASSLLIGDRTMLTEELQDQFAQTGTMHLLAISGLHVGILIGMILMLCRFFRCSSRETAVILLAILAAYVFITDLRPPVLRAGILATVAVLGIALGNQVDRLNALAVSAVLLLIAHPSDLFDLGAQLSFLAVGAILWAMNWNRLPVDREEPTLKSLLRELSPWRRRLKPIKRMLRDVYATTVAVNLVTLPITMATFHLVAPVGILLNLVLIPYISVVLGLGYLLLFGALLLPATAGILAVPFGWSLSVLQESIRWGQAASWGHLFVPDIPGWWLAGFYLLIPPTWQLIGTRETARKSFLTLLSWCVLGLLLPFFPASQRSLRCTFLSVGHGLAALMEFPDGKTLLYDAGTIGDGERAERAVLQLLWSRGTSRLDAAIVSHADHDHFSGLFGLIEKIPVGQLFVSRQFLDLQQRGVSDLCELAVRNGIRIQLLQAGDDLKILSSAEPAPRFRILSPAAEDSFRSDNAASLVLLLEYAGRRLLLTGDLERDGLSALLATPPLPVDVLLSPHHGGKVANVLGLYDWTTPRYAVVSSSDRVLPHLAGIPPSCTLFNTAISGAVTVEISRRGILTIHEHNRDSRQKR